MAAWFKATLGWWIGAALSLVGMAAAVLVCCCCGQAALSCLGACCGRLCCSCCPFPSPRRTKATQRFVRLNYSTVPV